jgi:hypothetical protein
MPKNNTIAFKIKLSHALVGSTVYIDNKQYRVYSREEGKIWAIGRKKSWGTLVLIEKEADGIDCLLRKGPFIHLPEDEYEEVVRNAGLKSWDYLNTYTMWWKMYKAFLERGCWYPIWGQYHISPDDEEFKEFAKIIKVDWQLVPEQL